MTSEYNADAERPDLDTIKKSSNFDKLQYYFPEDASDNHRATAKNPKEALKMRDPTNVTKQFPMPEGAFFCPPAPEDGSEPFKVPPAGTNAFDCSHLEAQAAQQAVQRQTSFDVASSKLSSFSSSLQESSGVNSVVNSTGYHSGPSVTSSAPQSEQTSTPKGTNAELPGYDPYAYLQGAQKALEGLSLTQQQQFLQQQQEILQQQQELLQQQLNEQRRQEQQQREQEQQQHLHSAQAAQADQQQPHPPPQKPRDEK